jgi:2-polyprenyl-3-methyl-5-hydroxy-6-metoxy-1,4-benzoquinol methylase
MSVLELTGVEEVAEQRDSLVGRLFQSTVGALELYTVYIGDRLGLYRALADGGPATYAELAVRGGIEERYAREWLEQQAAAGILQVDDVDLEAQSRRYRLPAGHAEVLLDRDSLAYFAPMARVVAGGAQVLPQVLDAFRRGGGVPWSAFGADVIEGQADANRPLYLNVLGREWLPSIPDIHARLQAEPSARAADIGCGGGWSSIAIALAYPNARVDGFDADATSVELARANAAAAGVASRVQFHLADAAALERATRYDLVTAFEMVHDAARPVELLRSMRGLLAEGGAALVMDERVGERFTAPSDEVERLMYAASVLCCLPAGMADSPSAGTGTVMRPDTLRRYAQEAGFADIEILPIEHDVFRVYRLIG